MVVDSNLAATKLRTLQSDVLDEPQDVRNRWQEHSKRDAERLKKKGENSKIGFEEKKSAVNNRSTKRMSFRRTPNDVQVE